MMVNSTHYPLLQLIERKLCIYFEIRHDSVHISKHFLHFARSQTSKRYDIKFRVEKNSIKTKRFDAASGTLS